MGVLRLLGTGFRSMPRGVAALTILLGAGVAAFGVVEPGLYTRPAELPSAELVPSVTLQPVRPDRATKRNEVNGIVWGGPGTRVISDVRVELVPLFDDPRVKRRTATTDGEGRFVFTDVEVTPGTPYVLDARFDGARFPSDVLRFPTSLDAPVIIVVAPTTKRADDLVLDVESIALVGDAKGLQAVHALTVRNRSDRAYVGRLRLPLLPGATAIDPRKGLDRRLLELQGSELVSRAPIVPGRHDITYTYVAPMPSRGLAVHHRAAYPTRRFELLVGGELTGRKTDGESSWKPVDIGSRGQERTYQRYEARDLEARETIAFAVSVKRGRPALRVAGLVAAGIVVVAIFALPFVRRRRPRDD
jgi:hypothetical protein